MNDGLKNGILDQAAVLLSRRGHLTRIDCRTSRYELIPAAADMPPFKILLAFSGLRKALVGTDYNRHVHECALAAFRDVRLTEVFVQRSKDREDPGNPRNYKRMVPIQYQETVHCLAFVLHIVAALNGSLAGALAGGFKVAGSSEPYAPPNPALYPYVVDGRCRFLASLGDVRVEGYTDFKRGSPWAKRRVLRGTGDGKLFEIEVSYLEGRKFLRIDGTEEPSDPTSSSYEHVLATATRWARQFGRALLMEGLFPNPRFARVAYQLSAALWRACRDRTDQTFASVEDLESWDACFGRDQIPMPKAGVNVSR